MPMKYSLLDLMSLADRMIGRGTSDLMTDKPELKRDCLMAGRIIAHLVLKGICSEPIEFE